MAVKLSTIFKMELSLVSAYYTHPEISVCRIQKFNMKCEIERMEISYTFYFFAFLKKVIKKLVTFCYWKDSKIYSD